MNTKTSITEENLMGAARGIVSRHTQIPPTPRDTLAVLRQAAERQQEKKDALFGFVHFRWAIGLASLMLIAAAGWWWGQPQGASHLTHTITEPIISEDLGLDLANWELEFTALWNEVNESLSDESDSYSFILKEI